MLPVLAQDYSSGFRRRAAVGADVIVKVFQEAACTASPCDGGGSNQDFTASGMSNVKAGIFFGNPATANGTAVDDISWFVGLTDGTNEAVAAFQEEHGQTTTDTGTRDASDETIMILDQTAAVDGEANISSTLSAGYRMAWGDFPASAYLINGVLFGGTDVQAAVSVMTHTGLEDAAQQETVGFEVDIIIFITSDGGAFDDGAVTQALHAIGIAHNQATDVQRAYFTKRRHGRTGATNAAHFSTSRVGGIVGNTGAKLGTLELTAIGATTFDLTKRETASDVSVAYLALKFTGANSDGFTVTMPNSTGDYDVTDTAWQPQFGFQSFTTMLTLDADRSNDETDGMMLGVFDGTTQIAAAVTSDDGNSTTDTQSHVASSTGIDYQTTTGVDYAVCTFTSFQSTGWRHNCPTTVPATASFGFAIAVEE